MNTVYKYPVPVDDSVTIEMPRGARILDLQMQNQVPCLWALVNTSEPMRQVTFLWRGTGHNANAVSADRHVGTVQFNGLVFHLFREI